jgi:dipeptidyl-peptidase-4
MYNFDGELTSQLTSGKWDVDEFLGVDQKRKRIYFTAAVESPRNTSLYYVKLKGGKISKLSENEGSNHADFSKGYNYYVNRYSNAKRPTVYSLHNADGKLIRVLKDNQKLVNTLKEYKIGTKEFFNFVTERGDTLTAYMIKPTHFDKNKKYPVLLNIYGGPESITVTNSWGGRNFLWASMIAEQGVIIVGVDPRGTKNRGREFKNQTYLKLGEYETEDFISAVRYMKNKPYVKADAIGIFGWSYGGFMALNCITRGSDDFTTAVAVAPVTNWRYYDNIYTERYMRTPQENPKGYDNNSPINHTGEMKGTLLLIHGDADDNVHVQNTMDMISALVKADKQFELFIYPNKNHGIYGGNTRKHLFEMISDFLKENL